MPRSARIVRVSRAWIRLVAAVVLAAGTLAAFPLGAQQAQQAQPSKAAQQAAARREPPLAPLANEKVLVLPVQLLRADSGAWVDGARWEQFRRQLDDSIGAAIAGRGIGRTWKYAADAVRIAKRNPDYVNNPYTMGVQSMRTVAYKIGDPLPEVFNDNLRALIALSDARYALVPVEIWFARKGPQQIAAIKIAMVDGRGGTFVWLGEVGSDPGTAMPPSLAGMLAARVADLIAAP
jgi:hypothetical protein